MFQPFLKKQAGNEISQIQSYIGKTEKEIIINA